VNAHRAEYSVAAQCRALDLSESGFYAANGGGPTNAVKDYYYGMFSFTKSMLLHDSNNDGVAEALKLLRSTTANVLPIRWYDAEQGTDQGFSEAEPGIPAGVALGPAPTHGIARTLVDDQDAAGYEFLNVLFPAGLCLDDSVPTIGPIFDRQSSSTSTVWPTGGASGSRFTPRLRVWQPLSNRAPVRFTPIRCTSGKKRPAELHP
jgi:hypothetical protein